MTAKLKTRSGSQSLIARFLEWLGFKPADDAQPWPAPAVYQQGAMEIVVNSAAVKEAEDAGELFVWMKPGLLGSAVRVATGRPARVRFSRVPTSMKPTIFVAKDFPRCDRLELTHGWLGLEGRRVPLLGDTEIEFHVADGVRRRLARGGGEVFLWCIPCGAMMMTKASLRRPPGMDFREITFAGIRIFLARDFGSPVPLHLRANHFFPRRVVLTTN
jgi:hypothetical protein